MRDLPCLVQRLIQNASNCGPYRSVKQNKSEKRANYSARFLIWLVLGGCLENKKSY